MRAIKSFDAILFVFSNFRKSFQKNSTPNNPDKVETMNNKFTTDYEQYLERHRESCNCDAECVTTINVIDALLCMSSGKSADAHQISAEHFHHAPLIFLQRISSLFNVMLRHSFVPRQFRDGVMIPLIKDHLKGSYGSQKILHTPLFI